jgi:hypothetical protein
MRSHKTGKIYITESAMRPFPPRVFSFFNLWGGTLDTATTTGLLYQPRKIRDGDGGEIDGMKNGRGNRSTREKTCPSAALSTTNST